MQTLTDTKQRHQNHTQTHTKNSILATSTQQNYMQCHEYHLTSAPDMQTTKEYLQTFHT
ncbi:hypothetical protein DMR_24770 [Solidesulfovibrio magneticus RS-1]|uniref:Uncharacterized protein n=1 Tax=Solidesulfovibrio magneticus (strain ATCC 700980 / DSM 13731 / RS-1) TaxID=573370 RepID=C4XTH1_SOLM1|nr:hypothetical protein DMR_24770 [Solidesulfovibrio magneticus RS-1]